MTTDEVFELFDHPMVDYIDFPMRYELMSSPVNYASLLSSSVVSQTTPWGISMVNAPQVWPITTGTGAKVMVIDTGMENHRSEEHTSELQSRGHLVCRLLLEK